MGPLPTTPGRWLPGCRIDCRIVRLVRTTADRYDYTGRKLSRKAVPGGRCVGGRKARFVADAWYLFARHVTSDLEPREGGNANNQKSPSKTRLG